MDEGYTSAAVVLNWLDLSIAAGLVVLAGLISVSMRLGIERRLGVAAVRTVVQLLLVGYVLRYIFEPGRAWLLAVVATIMIAAASRAAVARSSRVFRGATLIAFGTLIISALATTWSVTALVIGAEPWYRPQYMIPLLGMVLGNSLTGISLCLDDLLQTLATRGDEVQMELSLGATRWEAARGPVREAVRRGMIPIINAMMVVGIVSLPGMMTGQILAGADPLEAVKYQVVVMFMLAAATSLACMLITLIVYWRLFNSRHQLRSELIHKRGE